MTAVTDEDRTAWLRGALDQFERPLIAYAAHLVGDVHAARDVVQDVFLRLLRASRTEVEPILARWLYTVTRHRAVDHLRRGKVAAKSNADALDGHPARGDAPTGPETLAMRDDASQALEALGRLSAGHQEVLRLRLSHGLSYADIAQVTGLSVSHVGVRIHEGMKALRARLAEPASQAPSSPPSSAPPAVAPASTTRAASHGASR